MQLSEKTLKEIEALNKMLHEQKAEALTQSIKIEELFHKACNEQDALKQGETLKELLILIEQNWTAFDRYRYRVLFFMKLIRQLDHPLLSVMNQVFDLLFHADVFSWHRSPPALCSRLLLEMKHILRDMSDDQKWSFDLLAGSHVFNYACCLLSQRTPDIKEMYDELYIQLVRQAGVISHKQFNDLFLCALEIYM